MNINCLASRPWRTLRLPQFLATIPSMLTDEERQMLVHVVREGYAGQGTICDLGAYLGGSTGCLAYGLDPDSGAVVHAYDRFRFNDADRIFAETAGADLTRVTGGNTLPQVEANLAHLIDFVEFHPGDLFNQRVPPGPIELCVVDVAKTLPLNNLVVERFFTRLLPGALVVQQDYQYFRPPWDVASMEILADVFEPIGSCAQNSVIFRCTGFVTSEHVTRVRENINEHTDYSALIRSAAERFGGTNVATALSLVEASYLERPEGSHVAHFRRTRDL